MTPQLAFLLFGIGLFSGFASGIFGIGGGVLIVPALTLLAGYSQHLANGTSLAVLLPPVGIAAVIQYSRQGQVDFRAAAIIAISMILGSWIGSHVATQTSGAHLRMAFGVFVMLLGISLVVEAFREMS